MHYQMTHRAIAAIQVSMGRDIVMCTKGRIIRIKDEGRTSTGTQLQKVNVSAEEPAGLLGARISQI